MSFLSKRSRSQRSFIKGSDEISVRTIEPSDAIVHRRTDTLRSDSSSPPGPNAGDFKLSSCVLQKFPKHKASHLRFLAWVAYTRKFTDEPITEDERRTCPLLWCRTVFEDQETMLQHVWDCEHLSKGLYWCFHCQKPEQVGSFECRRCQGTPSKSDRITTVAKRIFSKLGSKRHRAPKATEPEPDMSIAKYADEAKTLEHHPDFPAIFDTGSAGDFNGQSFSGGGLLACRVSQELPDTQICEMTGSEGPMETCGTNPDWNGGGLSNPESIWFSPESLSNNVSPSNKSRRSLDMLPPLNTQLSDLNPERGFDHISSNDISDEPMSATINAPGGGDRYASIFQEISPTDTDMTGNSFLTDSGYTSGNAFEACGDSSMSSFELHPGFNGSRGKKRSREEVATTEALSSIDEVSISRKDSAKSNKSFTDQEQRATDTVDSSHSPSRCPSTKKPKMESPHWSSASTLVQSFSEVLDAHIFHTKEILRQLPQTPITTELLAMSRSSMVSIGLEVLAGIIEGRNPTAIVQAFAFTHVAYALTIAIDHDEIKVHTQEWFKDSLSWVDGLGSERERKRYGQIAKAIWQPVESLKEEVLPRFFAVDKDNRLLVSCKRFLDVLESFGPDDSTELSNKMADTAQITFSKKAQTQVIDELIKAKTIEAFIEDVVKIEKRLERGHIKTVRELELELMCAGKLASQSHLAYSRFLAHVTYLCNPLYGSSPSRSRAVFHIHNITLIKSLLPEEMYCGPDGEEGRDYDLELDDDLPLGFKLDTVGYSDRRLRDSMSDFVRNTNDAFKYDHDLNRSHSTQEPRSFPHTIPPRRSKSDQKRPANLLFHRSTGSTTFQSSRPSGSQPPPRPAPQSPPSSYPQVTVQSPSSSSEPSTSNASTPSHHGKAQSYECDLCDYIPTGDEKWKASNLRRHKRIQHAAADKKGTYICQWEGCTKSFTRSDNLRSHMRDKGHGIGEGFTTGAMAESDAEQSDQSLPTSRGNNRNTQQRCSDERGAKRRRMIR